MDDAEIFEALADIDAGELLADTTNIVSEVLADTSDIDELLADTSDVEAILEEIDAEDLLHAVI